MSNNPVLSIVTTTDPEAENLPRLLAALSSLALAETGCYEVIIVDDLQQWSSEQPPEPDALPGLIIRPIQCAPRQGQLKAIQTGLARAKAELILTIDPDLYPCVPEIPHMMAMINDTTPAVHAVRSQRSDLGAFRKLASRLVNIVVRKITGLSVPDIGSPITLFRKDVLQAIPGNTSGYQPNLRLRGYLFLGSRLCCYYLKNETHAESSSHYDARQLVVTSWRLLRDAIHLRRNGAVKRS